MAEKDDVHLIEEEENPGTSLESGSGMPRSAADRIANKKNPFFSRRPASLLLPLFLLILLVILGLAGAYYFFSASSPEDEPVTGFGAYVGEADETTENEAGNPIVNRESPVVAESRQAPAPSQVQTTIPDPGPGVHRSQIPKPLPEKILEPSPRRVLEPAHKVEKKKAGLVPSPDKGGGPAGYILQGGVFIVQTNLIATEKTIRALGFEPQRVASRRPVKMTRLLLGRYSPDEGRGRLHELEKLSPGAFLLKDDGQVAIYAGSYHDSAKAASYAETLSRQGLQVEEEPVEVVLPVTTLTFGDYQDMSAAREAAERARKQGLDVIIIKKP